MSADKTTYAQRRREQSKEALREQLRAAEYLRQLHELMGKEIAPEEVPAVRLKADIALRLLGKCLPDLKAVEHSGDLDVNHFVSRLPAPAENAEQWQAQHSPSSNTKTLQ